MKKLQVRLDEISVRNRQEYNKRSAELQKDMQLKGEVGHVWALVWGRLFEARLA